MAIEWPKDLQTLRVGPDHDFSLWLRLRHRIRVIGHVAWSKTCRWKVLSCWRLESEQFTRWCCKRVRHRIEGKFPGVTHRSDDGRRSEEVHGLDVSVVPRAEIPVEGREDGYGLVQCMINRRCSKPAVFFSIFVLALPLDGVQRHSERSRDFSQTCPIHGPHALANTVAPVFSNSSVILSRSIVALICSDPGVQRKGI